MVFLATKAKGPLYTRMFEDAKKQFAPVWKSRASDDKGTPLIRNDKYHGEDTAYFIFEWWRMRNNKRVWTPRVEGAEVDSNGINRLDKKYPEGSMVAT